MCSKICLTIIFITALSSVLLADEFELSCPYWYILFNRAGYIDITEWDNTPRHPHYRHEMMTGDYAAAVSYSGLNEAIPF